ncbi:carbonic anhydrase, chloroplastic isoform X2 [Cannabis sativa]|uniref:carbonic anhydrase, chloroplastic isoform X2 n=1 Tax=Cannabis sativa TaxID=3483 RepID=UPI0029C9F07B|nr:carbonic anhydrase, chloroplastic isoform X2 [Cannabis sativa]
MAEEQYSQLANYECAVKKNLVIISEKVESESESEEDESFDKVRPEHDLIVDPLKRIAHGFKHFLSNKYNKYPRLFDELAVTQHPKGKGCEVGSIIEYAVEELKIENILVIGHSHCGGIKRLMSHPEDGSRPFNFIDNWVNIAQAAKDKVKAEHKNLSFEEQCEICAEEAMNISLKNLYSYPFVRRGIQEKMIALRGGYYDFVAGSFKLWELQ